MQLRSPTQLLASFLSFPGGSVNCMLPRLRQTRTTLLARPYYSHVHSFGERPPDPASLLSSQEQAASVEKLLNWWSDKRQVLCITGAGLSTASGIPDYRGNKGSYYNGHKPMIHDHFMRHENQRKRYWGRGLVGWKAFEETSPNEGHHALAQLEKLGKLGVTFDDQPEFYDGGDALRSASTRNIALITQNVDTLHRRAGSEHLIELHGRTDLLKCMNCGHMRDRKSFHNEMEISNKEWLEAARAQVNEDDMRADGDAEVRSENYGSVEVPACTECDEGFLKPDVVFFGDSVPRARVELCRAAVQHMDGLFVVGSSLAVHSAFQHVRAADKKGTPIAVLNVGETRAETEGIDCLKIEAPAGPTLSGLVSAFNQLDI